MAPKVVEDNVASTRSLLGLCSFKDGDFFLGVSKTRGRGRGRGRGPLFFCFVFCCLALTKT